MEKLSKREMDLKCLKEMLGNINDTCKQIVSSKDFTEEEKVKYLEEIGIEQMLIVNKIETIEIELGIANVDSLEENLKK